MDERNDRERVVEAIADPDQREEIFYIVVAAIRLTRALYAGEGYEPFLHRLRKALESIWSEMPVLDQFGDIEAVPDGL